MKENSNPAFNNKNRASSHFALASFLLIGSCPGLMAQAHANSFERLSSLLAATPEGGWVKASTNFYSDAWPTGADAVPGQLGWPGAIVRAWSSFAWDSSRGDLMLWGGGHANYVGNEMYVWDGDTGKWGRGSLPSRTDSQSMIIGGTAPQSAHTYDNSVYLPVNDMFLTFGGAAAGTGSVFRTTDGGEIRRAGPYLWDPAKADPNKVGGTTGFGLECCHSTSRTAICGSIVTGNGRVPKRPVISTELQPIAPRMARTWSTLPPTRMHRGLPRFTVIRWET